MPTPRSVTDKTLKNWNNKYDVKTSEMFKETISRKHAVVCRVYFHLHYLVLNYGENYIFLVFTLPHTEILRSKSMM